MDVTSLTLQIEEVITKTMEFLPAEQSSVRFQRYFSHQHSIIAVLKLEPKFLKVLSFNDFSNLMLLFGE